ncbi:MAG: hypothetical protein J6I45_11715 [Clostridia bacterium]|nr:hypothetical protein [Clostridia bacterium]
MSGRKILKSLAPLRTAAPLAAALLILLFAAGSLRDGGREEGKRQLEEALRLSAVACYAAEGIYPPDIAYLEEHYGLQINHERYAVFYEIFAENIMPDITVVELEK